ncbi:MAG: hypothetical protein DRO67_09805 [Candidatus Asgardarchaeum californiense]|nr:MAG: hypothetical protein DRO67_09805 [Candidatus Asgardarchaeum californiense]
MKFAILGHLLDEKNIKEIPKEWIHEKIMFSSELDINGTKGYMTSIKLMANQMMMLNRESVRRVILDAVLFVQDELDVGLIQLGGLTTSVTSGGVWLTEQKEYKGYVTHGDSYTAAVTCQAVRKALELRDKNISEQTIAVVGAYGIIGEAVSKILVPEFKHSILIGRREEPLKKLKEEVEGSFETTTELRTIDADVVVTATSHPTALLKSEHLKKNAIVVDVSQPPNLSFDVCQKRPDVFRVDGGYVSFPEEYAFPIPGMPKGKIFACIAEAVMQAMENEHENHVGSIDLDHLHKTEKWAEKYGYMLNELTNFGKPIKYVGGVNNSS